jgi:hypothetical protein
LLLNDLFAMAILDLISRVHLASFVVELLKWLKYSTIVYEYRSGKMNYSSCHRRNTAKSFLQIQITTDVEALPPVGAKKR